MKCPVGIALVFCLLVGSSVEAASLYIDPGINTISRGDALQLSVRLDTDESIGECVNAVEGVLTFTGPIVPVDVSTGDSIFSIWVEPPTLSADRTQITFAGGIPNGYCGRVDGDPRLTNNVFNVIVRADSMPALDGLEASASVSFTSQTVAYLNDGLGTVAELEVFPSNITVLPQVGEFIADPWSEAIAEDTIAPQAFSIQLSKDSLAYTGRYIVSFNTTDKQTGIDRYEVMEEPFGQFDAFSWGRADAPWIETRSPHVLQDQTLNSIIRVRAVDKAGNVYVATYVPDESLRTLSFEDFLTYLLLGMLVLMLALGSWVFGRRYQQKKREHALASIQSQYQPPTQQ